MKIWLVWKTNVGKSSIFNKLIWMHRAIITDIAWTTRQIISEIYYPKEDFPTKLYDSPGLEDFSEEMEHIEEIIKKSDLILFIIDWKNWFTNQDEIIRDSIIKNWKLKDTVLIANKLDWKVNKPNLINYISDYYSLWFNEIIATSAKNIEWLDELNEYISDYIDENNFIAYEEKVDTSVWISLIWRPNSWKSTLLNKFSQDEISLVQDSEWTTLDYIISKINYKWEEYTLYDTAWIRKKGKIHWLEKIALSKTTELIKYKKPISIILIDVSVWLTHTDKTIISQIEKLNVPIIIALNKSDLLDKKTLKLKSEQIIALLSFGKHIPIVEISAKSWFNLNKLLDFAKQIHKEFYKEIWTSELNKALNKAWLESPPRFPKNKICKFYYATQTWTAPAKFLVFINNEEKANFAFKKWLSNVIRRNFWFVWCPIKIEFKEK